MERVDISAPMRALCDALGLTYENVAWVQFEPHRTRAFVYRVDENGNKFLLPDGRVAGDELVYEVTT